MPMCVTMQPEKQRRRKDRRSSNRRRTSHRAERRGPMGPSPLDTAKGVCPVPENCGARVRHPLPVAGCVPTGLGAAFEHAYIDAANTPLLGDRAMQGIWATGIRLQHGRSARKLFAAVRARSLSNRPEVRLQHICPTAARAGHFGPSPPVLNRFVPATTCGSTGRPFALLEALPL